VNFNLGKVALSASNGEANRTTVSYDPVKLQYSITDPSVRTWVIAMSGTDGNKCGKVGATIVCSAIALRSQTISLGDGNDTLALNTDLAATIEGGPGNDVIAGGRGNDVIAGGNGGDTIAGGAGADTISGGNGDDTVDYSAAKDPVSVTHDATANDGTAAERDNVAADVEGAVGGAGNDVLHAGAAGGELHGGPGDDVLYGDVGDDVLDGGAGIDSYFAAGGADKILALDGAVENVDCGDGVDEVTADPDDALDPNCDQAQDPGTGTGGGDPPTTTDPGSGDAPQPDPGRAGAAPDIVLPVRPVSVQAPGLLQVRLGCAADANAVCRGDIYLEAPARYFARGRAGHKLRAARGQQAARQRRLAHRRFKVAAGKKVAAHVRVAFRGHYVLRNRKRPVHARLRIVQRNAAGKVLGTTVRPVKLGRKWARSSIMRGRHR
jgi:hypothetical protein